ncbi:hypothetical protein SAMN04487770_102303 [Butyrivibrio sp. ob235]|uniref:hypothetical protein n=1 Tax=Butyrivibrio sp. ob235 TaxID=1761780 RepID=UPI0008C86F50|nr:hypothetical protein [Butyrivibrio sp. ob235]SEK71200.1 hypothetical protein SAMN04487770_102303 [Butyrivibrio sp. ob235]
MKLSYLRLIFICFSVIFSLLFLSTVNMISYAAGSSKTFTKHYDTYKDWWIYDGKIPDIVSKDFKPDSKTQKLLDEAEKKGIVDFAPEDTSGYEGKGEVYYKVVAQTPSFTLFFVGETCRMLLKTEDSSYVYIDVPAVSLRGIFPECTEYDLDSDGDPELVIKPQILHGTGYYEEFVLIADIDKKSKCTVYFLNPEDYLSEVAEHVEAKESNGNVSLYVDGIKEGTEVASSDLRDDFEPGLYLENIIYFRVYDGIIWIGINPMFDAASLNSPDVMVWYPVTYEGDGDYTGGEIVCRPFGYDVYQKVTESFTEDDMYTIWDNPIFQKPLLLTADKKDSIDKSKTYEIQVSACKVSMMKNGKFTELGTIESADKNPVSMSPDGIVAKGKHFLYVYEATPDCRELVIKDGVEDNTISNFSNHKGYIRIRNGKAENITKNEYEAIYKTYENAVPIEF